MSASPSTALTVDGDSFGRDRSVDGKALGVTARTRTALAVLCLAYFMVVLDAVVVITALPRMQREVFLLRAQQGLEYEEIAAALDTSPGAARVHYHHAVRRLKEYVQ